MSSSGVILLNLENRNAAEFESILVPGSYDKALGAATAGSYITVYKWLYNGFAMTASLCTAEDKTEYISLVDKTNGGELKVYSDDTITLLGGAAPVVLTTLDVEENGTFLPPEGYDGFSQVSVNVGETPPVLTTLEAEENGTYFPPEGYDGFSQVSVSVESAVEPLQNPYINPIYYGLCTAYNSLSGDFYQATQKNQCLNFYEIEPGTYCVFVGQTVGARFRALFFSGKEFSDFAPYLDSPAQAETAIYQSDLNITGSTELSGDNLQRRFFFTVQSKGTLIVGTDNLSEEIPSMLFMIADPITRIFKAYHIYSGSITDPYTMIVQKGHFVGTEFSTDWTPNDFVADGEPITVQASSYSARPYICEGVLAISYATGWFFTATDFAHEYSAGLGRWLYFFGNTVLEQLDRDVSWSGKYYCANVGTPIVVEEIP